MNYSKYRGQLAEMLLNEFSLTERKAVGLNTDTVLDMIDAKKNSFGDYDTQYPDIFQYTTGEAYGMGLTVDEAFGTFIQGVKKLVLGQLAEM